jgi:hypothetical protein
MSQLLSVNTYFGRAKVGRALKPTVFAKTATIKTTIAEGNGKCTSMASKTYRKRRVFKESVSFSFVRVM